MYLGWLYFILAKVKNVREQHDGIGIGILTTWLLPQASNIDILMIDQLAKVEWLIDVRVSLDDKSCLLALVKQVGQLIINVDLSCLLWQLGW